MATIRTNHYPSSALTADIAGAQTVSSFEIEHALEKILSSCLFNRAHRMCRLLRYLIESRLSNANQQMSEYAIALDVFDRNPSTYYPGDDPIVRVQMGRLRKRLVSYYAESADDLPVIVSIPLGHYEPVIERRQTRSEKTPSQFVCQLAVFPLHYISDDFLGRSLTTGVNEQLHQQFQQTFGTSLTTYSASFDVDHADAAPPKRYFLEGSSYTHGASLRLNIRLIDQHSNAIVYTAQFVLSSSASLAEQASMAEQMCEAVGAFLLG